MESFKVVKFYYMVETMALFGSSNKKSVPSKVRPTVVRTQNVAKEIFNLAKSYDVKPEALDFNLLGVQTYTRMFDGKQESEFSEVKGDELYALEDSGQLLDPQFQIKQTYEVELFSIQKDKPGICQEFKAAVGANATKCKVYLSVPQGSVLVYKEHLESDLKMFIDKKKIRAGILIGIFDEMVDDLVSKISAKARINGKVEFEQNETFLIAEGYEPTQTTNDALILHFENDNEVDENERIDYAARGFIKSVKQDEVLIEYVKPRPGKPGRNCRGEYMQPEEPTVNHLPTFDVDDTIKVVETDKNIQYIAKENGYIAFENNTYTIKKDVDVSEISFKTTGSILSGVDSDVSIDVKESDAIKDAIGSGMVVEVSEINVDGNVGSNAKVIAKEVSIGGQTHKTSYINADKIDINVHKGKAEGKEVHVTRLEHGFVKADRAEIAQALGGTILARDIKIEVCASHVKATATHTIEIEKLHGSENTFTIDPLLSDEVQESVQDNEERIKELEIEIRDTSKDVQKYKKLVKEGMPAFLEIKKRLLHYQKNKIKMPEAFVKKYKQFQAVQEKLKSLEEQLKRAQDQLNLLGSRTASFQDNIYDARIINRGEWIGYNEIKFKLVDPPMELVYKPAEGSSEKVFGLQEVDDGEYAIRPMSE